MALFKVDYTRVKEQIIPKMALQQLVENCVKHGFAVTIGQRVIGGWFKEGKENIVEGKSL
ncbi:MAG: hypothetical protein Q4C61_08745 [Lachnospiraceae bacterium]|nr:hypothetical protein [Lachnospiraceae bacterium]